MNGRIFFGARLVVALAATLGLAACGDGEAAQRKAFEAFLQSRIIDKPGIHVPTLTADERASFGDYAKHYDVIADFNARLDQSVSKPLRYAIETSAPRSISEMVARRRDIAAVKNGMGQIRAALDRELKTADAAHAALKEPDDLKPIFDAAYERDVTQPAEAWVQVFPTADDALASILALAAFLDQYRDKVAIDGGTIRVSDPALEPPLQALLDDVRSKNDGVVKAQQRLNAL